MSITRKMLKGMGLTEDQQISTHATREGRQKAKRVAEVSLKFLLTPLREGRLGSSRGSGKRSPISTHAPARGATEGKSASEYAAALFLLMKW